MSFFSGHEEHEEAYGQGAQDAENAGFLEDLFHSFGDTVTIFVPETTEHQSYEKGYHDHKRQ